MKPYPYPPENFAATFNHLVDALPELAVVLFAPNLHCTLAQGKTLSRLGLNEADIIGQPVTGVLAALARIAQSPPNVFTPEVLEQGCRAVIAGETSAFEFGAAGGAVYSVRLLPLGDAAGGGGMMLIQAASLENRPEASLQRFIEAAPDAMLVTNADGLIVLANSHMEEMFGYAGAELLGQPVEILLPSRLHHRHAHHQRSYTATPKVRHLGSGLNLVGITKDGREFPVDISLSPLPTPAGMLIVSAIRNVAEQKRIETELKQAHDELEQRVKERTVDLESRNKELDAFAQTVAHDLKNPLAIITGMAELMLQYFDELTDDEVRNYLGLIARDGRKLDNIINELMVLSGLANLEPMLEPTNVAGVAEESITRLESMVKQYQAKITCHCNWPWASGYAPWIETVWVNYLSNAIKYGGTPPIIELGANPAENGMVRYWIKDNGNGLTTYEQTKLFTAFTRLSDIKVQGYGVGLSVVKRAIEKLGGQVGVESRVGEGSVFYFTLKAAEPQPAGDEN